MVYTTHWWWFWGWFTIAWATFSVFQAFSGNLLGFFHLTFESIRSWMQCAPHMKRLVFRIYPNMNLDDFHKRCSSHDKVTPSDRLNMALDILRNKPFGLRSIAGTGFSCSKLRLWKLSGFIIFIQLTEVDWGWLHFHPFIYHNNIYGSLWNSVNRS